MKRRLQMFLEKTYGSAYSTDRDRDRGPPENNKKAPPTAQPPLQIAGEGGKKKGRASKNKPQKSQSSSPAGERFDLRCDVHLAARYSSTWRDFLFWESVCRVIAGEARTKIPTNQPTKRGRA